ncbi:MAG: M14 family metallopeptidase [Bacteroidota bacterium]|nr:M14 family metallopeptidase [Bacteroidota bacterium]
MKYFTLFTLIVLTFSLSLSSFAQNKDAKEKKEKKEKVKKEEVEKADPFQTYYEKSGFTKTARYKETIEYCKKLANESEFVEYKTFGKSPQGRDLPLLVIDRDGYSEAREVKQKDRVVLLIQAGIHPGEIDGKDAGLMFIRDIVLKKKNNNLLRNVTILFIPIFNVDGHEHFGPHNRINQNGPEKMGWRTTASNLNLNRDFLKADASEMRDWVQLFIEWLPDFFIDIHATDGADYQYVTTYGMEIFGNMTKELTEWQKDDYLKYLEKKMSSASYPIFPYVSYRNWHDPRSGLISWVASPMLSEGYTALQNRPGLLVENHMLKDYKTRVSATYELLMLTTKFLNKDYNILKTLVKEADKYTASQQFRDKKFTVKYKPSSDSTIVEFKGYEYEIVKSDLTGGNWFKYSKIPKTFEIPYFNKQEAEVQINIPEAYIIPPEWTEVIDRLELHGVSFFRLKKAVKTKVISYIFKDVKFANKPYEGRQRVIKFDYDKIEEVREYPEGSVVVDMEQGAARIAIHILEPKAPSSFLYWGFFNSIFEQKEYGESYVMEEVARKMLKDNDALKKEFEKKKSENPEFAKNQWLMLNWFYSKSKYWDDRINKYPVGKIYDRKVLKKFTYK